MIRWIQNQRWLPEIAFALLLIFGGSLPDYYLQGQTAALISLLFAIAAFFIRRHELIGIGLICSVTLLEIFFNLTPLLSGKLAFLLVFFAAAFGNKFWALMFLVVQFMAQVPVTWNTSFNSHGNSSFLGISLASDQERWIAFGISSLFNLGIISIAWLLGTWLTTYFNERRLQRERTSVDGKQVRLAIDLAEQNERIGIAKDLNLVATQQLSAVIALVEGARYAARVEPEVATRTLERLDNLLREMHTEMRQLQDSLSRSVSVAPAPPNIFDLEALVVQYRELGYNCVLTHEGKVLQLLDSAELAIYRIVFDALENVRKHAPVGTSVAVAFSWQNDGLQILVKDNGTETSLKMKAQAVDGQYDIKDDMAALVQEFSGIGLTAMQERASLLGGTIEAKQVPGVGFTLNAIFPSLQEVIKA